MSQSDGRLLDGVDTTSPTLSPHATPQEVDNLFADIASAPEDRLLSAEATASTLVLRSPVVRVEDLFDDVSKDRALKEVATVRSGSQDTTKSAEHEALDSITEGMLNEVSAQASSSANTALPADELDLFDYIVSNSQDKDLDIDSSPAKASPAPPESEEDQTHQAKELLLSSIQALKTELAAKNELLSKQTHVASTDAGGVVSSMTEEFTCVICQELFISAHTLPCSHSFCEFCIKEWIKTKKECPICRKCSLLGPVHTLALDNAIAAVESKLSAEEKKERDALKEGRKAKMNSFLTPSSSGTSSTDPDSSLDYETAGSGSSDGEADYEGPDMSDVSDLDVDYYGGGIFVYNGGYGGFGRCYHCGKYDVAHSRKVRTQVKRPY